jgi:uncharacterized damage-inducible protein DinB
MTGVFDSGLRTTAEPRTKMQSSSPIQIKRAQFPSARELQQYWDEVNAKLHAQFASLSAEEWLQPHYAMSEEDYAKDPTRLAVLLSRTNHLSHHSGQVTLAIK